MPTTSTGKARTERADAASLWAAGLKWLTRPIHHRAVHDFRIAAERRDGARLEALLDPGVAVVVDSGDTEHQTIRVVHGTFDAIPLLVHGMGAQPGLEIAEGAINGQAGLTLSRGGEVTAAINLDFTGRRISMVWIQLQPELVRRWNTV
ncbi:hypothetical protein [Homoserinimonas sp. A520]